MPTTAEFRRAAAHILAAIGGKENIQSHSHCALRLRFVLRDENLVQAQLLEKAPLVKGHFSHEGEYQIVIGMGIVEPAYAQVQALLDGTAVEHSAQTGFFSQFWHSLKQCIGLAKPSTQTNDAAAIVLDNNPIPSDWQQPISGKIVPLSAVPDAAFASGNMGIGFAIEPNNDSAEVRSPVSGTVIAIFPTKHAIGIRATNGIELLIHVGIDSIQLGGEGIQLLVGINKAVQAGQALLQVDWQYLQNNTKSSISPIIFPDFAASEWQLSFHNQQPILSKR